MAGVGDDAVSGPMPTKMLNCEGGDWVYDGGSLKRPVAGANWFQQAAWERQLAVIAFTRRWWKISFAVRSA